MECLLSIYLIADLFHIDGIIQVVVNQNATAVLTNNDFLSLTDFTLTLRWNGVETTSTGIANNRYDSQSISVVGANAII